MPILQSWALGLAPSCWTELTIKSSDGFSSGQGGPAKAAGGPDTLSEWGATEILRGPKAGFDPDSADPGPGSHRVLGIGVAGGRGRGGANGQY